MIPAPSNQPAPTPWTGPAPADIPAGSPWAPPPVPAPAPSAATASPWAGQPSTAYPSAPQAPQPWGQPNGRPYTGPGSTHGYPQYSPYPQYQYGQYPQYPQATGARGSQASHVLIGVLLVPAVVFLLIIVVKVMSAIGGSEPEPAPTPSQPTVTSTQSPTNSGTSGQTNNQPANGTYKNDTYDVPAPNLNPPDLPVPVTYDQATLWMQSNVFYDQVVPTPVRCEIPDINPSSASKSQLQTYLNDIVACLMRVWAPELQAAGFNASRPSVTIYSGQTQTPCGRVPKQNAFYCSADQQIYYATDLPMLFPQYKADPYVPLSIIAHEFGHAIQAQTGILYSEAVWQQSYEDENKTDLSNAVSRRTEMQADCFAGQVINAISQSAGISSAEISTLQDVFYSIGDDQLAGIPGFSEDHGTGANRQKWLEQGLGNPLAGTCNTFAPSVKDSQIH